MRPSNFELRDFSYKANSFPYADIYIYIYEDLPLKAAGFHHECRNLKKVFA